MNGTDAGEHAIYFHRESTYVAWEITFNDVWIGKNGGTAPTASILSDANTVGYIEITVFDASGGVIDLPDAKGINLKLLDKIGFTSFTDADTTPSVQGGSTFQTANTGATVISMFDDGQNGQTIFVLINDANTTIDFTGTSLEGNGLVDWTPASGDSMMCTYTGSNWYCQISATTSGDVVFSDITATSTINTPEIYNTSGGLKIQPDVQGDTVLFGDTDVGNGDDGKAFTVHRKAAEGDSFIKLWTDNNKISYFELGSVAYSFYNDGSSFNMRAADGYSPLNLDVSDLYVGR